LLPPGLDRAVRVDGDRIEMTVSSSVPGLLVTDHVGCLGVLARGDARGVEAMVHAVAPTAAVECSAAGDRLTIDVDVAAGREPVKLPDAAALTRLGIAASWTFVLS
jgi:hypothetical protein